MKDVKSAVALFKNDLWKDQRIIEIIQEGSQKFLIKHYSDLEEMQTELSVTHFLLDKHIDGIPSMHKHGESSTAMPYYSGIRLFNLFVDLDILATQYDDNIRQMKANLISHCELRQRKIQAALLEWRVKQAKRLVYPQSKVSSIVGILANCLDIIYDQNLINEEVTKINQNWNRVASVPFRDATSKNMILNSPKLHMSNFASNEERCWYIYKTIVDGTYHEWLDAPIVDIDFSSTLHDTTLEDDLISLKYHERTWNGRYPNPDELIWFGEPAPKRAALTFLIRYFRFGGRKAAYRLLHPNGHKIRFKYDNDIFYFTRLPGIMKKLWPKCEQEYPSLIKFIEVVSTQLCIAPVSIDSFLECGEKPTAYYTDIFPN